MLDTPFSPWPSHTEAEADAVRRVLLSNRVNYWTGEETRRFEEEFAAWTGCAHAVALANGTVALELALKGLGIGPGDEVVVTPRTFIASASAIVTVGASPVFADVDRDTQALSAATIEAVLTPAARAVVVVHHAGRPADMDPIVALARERGLKVVEDCAQAHGARYRGRPVGSIGDVGAWSFCQDKIMTTGGEGGMVATDDETLWRRMWEHKDHGKSWEAVYEREHPPGYRWLHESFGTNWRMNEIQGVIGRLQLAEMPRWHAARSANAHRIWDACRAMPWLRVPRVPDDVEHGAYRAFAFVRSAALPAGWDRDRIVDAIAAEGVPCASRGSAEIYLERAFDGTGFRPPERLPTAHELAETAVAFLVHPTLTDLEIEATCRAIGAVGARIEAERGGGAGSVRGASAC